jgi:hypothetical protein
MASDSATAIATQQSIKAYVDSQVGSFDTLAEVLAQGNTTGSTDIAVDSAQKVQFRDAAIYINSSVDGQLDIVADTEIQIAATTVDLNGNLDVSGTLGVTGVATLASLVATTADINAGTIDGTVIGGSTAAAGTFTTFTSTGIDDNATSTAITIDSNETVDITTGVLSTNGAFYYGSPTVAQVSANRNSTTGAIPNASNSSAYLNLNTPAGSSSMEFVLGDAVNTQPSLKMIITGAGNVGIGTSLPGAKLDVQGNVFIGTTTVSGMGPQTGLTVVGGATVSTGDPGILTLGAHLNARSAGDPIGKIDFYSNDASGGASGVQASIRGITEGSIGESAGLTFYTGTSSSLPERLRIDASGNVGIGASGALTSTYLSKAFVYTAGGANFAIGGLSDTNNAVLGRFTSYNVANSNSGNEESGNFFGVTSIESIVVTTDSNAGDDSGGSLLFKTKPEAGALAERMRIDANGNVQQATSVNSDLYHHIYNANTGTSAESTLYVSNGSTVSGLFAGATGTDFTTTGGFVQDGAHIGSGGASAGGLSIMTRASAPIRFYTNGHTNERMRIDASGNVGIGTSSPEGRLDVNGGILSVGVSTGDDVEAEKIRIGRSNSNVRYHSIVASHSGVPASSFLAFNIHDASGSPYTAQTQALKLQGNGNVLIPNGNVGIGTSPDTTLHLQTPSGTKCEINFAQTAVTNYRIGVPASTDALVFTYGGSTERMRLDENGNVGIGVVPSAWGGSNRGSIDLGTYGAVNSDGNVGTNLTVNMYTDGTNWNRKVAGVSGVLYNQSNDGHEWYYDSAAALGAFTPTVRMKLDTSGNLLVGKSAASPTAVGWEARPTGATFTGYASTSNDDWTSAVYSTTGTAYRFYVGMAGTVFATSTVISAISDIRYKENVRDLDDGLDKIMALKPRKFDWKEGKGRDVKDDRGWIAQELEVIFPDMIDEWADPSPEGEEPYKAVRPDLIPVLVKAIQEQQATIEALTARIAALES